MLSIVASPDGKFVFVSNLDGQLNCVEASTRAVVAEWRPEDAAGAGSQEPAILTLLCANVFSDDAYLITAIDNLGNFQFCAQFLANVNSSSRSLYVVVRPSVCRLSSVCL